MSRLDVLMSRLLKHEGGYVDHPEDPGGATNMGITRRTLARYRGVRSVAKSAVKELTVQEATEIYDKYYWRKVQGDSLPIGIDYTIFDAAVNSGPRRAIKWLQKVLGVTVDGIIGPQTREAARKANAVEVIALYNDKRLAFLQRLRTWNTFKRGWSRRVADVRRDSLRDATSATVDIDALVPAKKVLEVRRKRIKVAFWVGLLVYVNTLLREENMVYVIMLSVVFVILLVFLRIKMNNVKETDAIIGVIEEDG